MSYFKVNEKLSKRKWSTEILNRFMKDEVEETQASLLWWILRPGGVFSFLLRTGKTATVLCSLTNSTSNPADYWRAPEKRFVGVDMLTNQSSSIYQTLCKHAINWSGFCESSTTGYRPLWINMITFYCLLVYGCLECKSNSMCTLPNKNVPQRT